jgi:hypothetical protein
VPQRGDTEGAGLPDYHQGGNSPPGDGIFPLKDDSPRRIYRAADEDPDGVSIMPRYKVHPLQGEGRTIGIYPVMDKPYKMQCCDCGLVHDLYFKVVRELKRYPNGTFDTEDVEDPTYRVEMVVGRNNRATGQIRRHRK